MTTLGRTRFETELQVRPDDLDMNRCEVFGVNGREFRVGLSPVAVATTLRA